jgi:hypothetical protein
VNANGQPVQCTDQFGYGYGQYGNTFAPNSIYGMNPYADNCMQYGGGYVRAQVAYGQYICVSRAYLQAMPGYTMSYGYPNPYLYTCQPGVNCPAQGCIGGNVGYGGTVQNPYSFGVTLNYCRPY